MRAEEEGKVKRFPRENNFMHVPGKSLAKRWKSKLVSKVWPTLER